MECKENDTESKDIQITEKYIEVPIYLNGEKYLLNIYLSKDNINIIFKIEKEKIQTSYYFSKFDLKDFKSINKIFLDDINIHDIFLHLKTICKKYIINLELVNKSNKIFIIFQNIEIKKIRFKFTLLKKIVSQEKLNPLLEDQIQDNKLKLNFLRNQIIKMDKSINIKNDIINNIKTTLSSINEKLNNISLINANNNLNTNINSNSVSTKNSSSIESNSNSENNSCNNNSINNNEDDYQEETIKDQNNFNNNSSNKKENNDKVNNNNENNNNPNAFFCYDSSQNKKIIEFLIILNVVTILIVLYILGSNYDLRINLEFDTPEENENGRLTYLSFVGNSRNNDNFRDIFQENLELQKNKEEGTLTDSKIKDEYIENKKKKMQERLYNYYDYI